MKIINIALTLLLLAGISTSCIKEDHSECNNVYCLALSYMGDEQTEIFPEKIDRVHMYVFDSQNNCVTSGLLSDADVVARLTTLPALEPGEYKIVCIGNAYETEVENLSSKDMEKVTFASADYLSGATVTGNDPLYWSSVDYTIAPYSEYKLPETRTTFFESSHFDVYVEVVGVPSSAEFYPVIEFTGTAPQTDFNNDVKTSSTDYILETKHDGNATLSALTNIMRRADSSVNLNVKASDGSVMASVNFAEHIAKNNIDITKNECLIPFLIEFKSADISISVPSWFVENIQPEFK
jgi:hypothetical protein